MNKIGGARRLCEIGHHWDCFQAGLDQVKSRAEQELHAETGSSCELPEVIVHVNLQELAPLFWRHLAEQGVRFPGSGRSCVRVRLQDFQQLGLFIREVESLRMRDFEARWKP